MKKKTKIILTAGSIVVVVLMALMFIFMQGGTYVYTNKEIGFKLTLQKNWKPLDTLTPTFNYQFENKNYILQIYVILKLEDFGKNMSTIVNETIELFSNATNANFTIESYNPKTINGMQAYEFNITGRYEYRENLTKAKLIKVNNNEKYFDIICEGTPSFLFDEHADEIEKIINSFVIL